MALLQLFCVLACVLTLGCGSYVITTPRSWTSETSQVCISITDPSAPAGALDLRLSYKDWGSPKFDDVVSLANSTIDVPEGTRDKCFDVEVPSTDRYSVQLQLLGTVAGAAINRTVPLSLKKTHEITFIQTDKYLYKPGQNVKFRVLTLQGPEMKVSTRQYVSVWVTSPTRTRIAQWKKVDNTPGLLHLDFHLADEPEKGIYTIQVKTQQDNTEQQTFKVEEFVLPRFEVKIKPPKYSLASDEAFTFTVCASYTFGQPVRGNLSFTVDNKNRNKCLAKVTKNLAISGCSEVTVTSEEMKVTNCRVHSLDATARVVEAGTGVEITAESPYFPITRTAVIFKTLYEDKYVRPNLPYILKLRAELPDGSPAGGVPVEVCASGRCNNMTTAPDGLFTTILPSYNTNRVFMKTLNCRAMMDQSSFTKDLEHYFSPSNSSLLIHAPEGKLKCASGEGQDLLLPVFFSASGQTSAIFTVQVVSRGKVQYMSSKEYQLSSGELPINVEHLVEPLPPPLPNTTRGVVNIKVNIPLTASPKVKVLVWYTREDGEVVADTRELEVEKCLGNTVNLAWSASRAQPGHEASLSLSTEPNSFCSLGVVDRSSELLMKNHDPITLESLFQFTSGFEIQPWVNSQINTRTYCQEKNQMYMETDDGARYLIIGPPVYYYSDYVDAITMFSDAGVYVFSDKTLETRPCEEQVSRHYYSESHYGAPLSGMSGMSMNRKASVSSDSISYSQRTHGESPDVEAAPRSDFPETWLWDTLVVPSSGVSTLDLTLPDTITEWVGKAVCAHPQKGVGLSQRETITSFTPFFVDLTLPPTIKRGEILPVKMSVFNYLDQPIPVTVEVRESAEYEIVDEAGKRSSCLPAQDKVVHTVRIKPREIGEVNITVAAFVDHDYSEPCGSGGTSIDRRDALIKGIKVEAEGFLREVALTKYICSTDLETGEDSLDSWELVTPEVIVEGSERAWVTAGGDLLALSLENLGHLIRMPYGCGEQNMINFVPNIFIMQYLKASRQATPESTAKLLSFMKTGYQRELLYLRYDGSFSAFGNADASGSTWLTAFVLKSFAQAEEFILIDRKRVNKTSSWLRKHQGFDGCFSSVGTVFSKAMKGGIGERKSAVPLTAYVAISLLEAGEGLTADEDRCNSTKCQISHCLVTDTSLDPYTLALKAYALALAKLPEAEVVLQQLLDQAVVAKNSTYWQLPKGSGQSRGIAVEVAGYAVLAMMTLDPEGHRQQALKVIKWITSQRNGQGGFYSTQDTVVALQALAVFETHSYQGALNVVATVTASSLSHAFTVTDDNKLLQQLVKLPSLPTKVSFALDGQGCVVIQGVLRYNIPEAEASDAFSMTVTAITAPDVKCVTKRVTVCAAYRLPDGRSNMAVTEVDLVSGYIPEKEDLKKVVREDVNVKRYDVDGSKVAFYIEGLAANSTCIKFRVIREIEVENVKPGSVRLYDYYQPEFQISKSYTLPPVDECS
nr:murinoglobulin-1-like [Procambarus clarkii]